MNEVVLIYLYLAVGNFLSVFTLISCVSCFVGLFAYWPIIEEYPEHLPRLNKINKRIAPITILFILAFSLYPSKEDLRWIIGGALVWNGVEAARDIEGINKLPENTVKAMNSFLESISTEEAESKK